MIAFAKFLSVMATNLQFSFSVISSSKILLNISGQENLFAYDDASFFVPSDAELQTMIKNAFFNVPTVLLPIDKERDFIEKPIKVSTLLLFTN